MGIFDWLRPRPKRFSNAIARELAEATFALHPAAAERVIVIVDRRQVVASMAVPSLDPTRAVDVQVDRALYTARVSELIGELARNGLPLEGNQLTVMRDRVIWMPAVVTFQPPIA